MKNTIAFPFEAATREHSSENLSGTLDAMGEVIKKYRRKADLTQAELAEELNVKRNTVVAWESGRSRPPLEVLMTLTQRLSIPITELFSVQAVGISREEENLLFYYRKLNKENKKVALNMVRFMEQEEETAKAEMLENDFHILATEPTSAAAGKGTMYLDNEKPLIRFYRKNDYYRKADFVCKVDGHSMEPAFPDQCYVYCQRADDAPDGSVVICDSDDGRLIKQKQGNILISINPLPQYKCKKYPDDAVTIRGIVLGIVPEDDFPDKDIIPELQDVHNDEIAEFKEEHHIWDD